MFKTVVMMTWLCLAISACGQTAATPGGGSSQTFVSQQSATLQSMGEVKVDERFVADTSTVIAEGDRVETGPFAAARISAPGLAVYLPANSCVTYRGQQLDVCNCGSVQVSARKPVSVMFKDQDLLVSSQTQNGVFTVSAAGTDLEVVNQEGITSVVKSGTVLSRLSAHASQSLAGLGCRMTVNHFSSAAGAAAAIAAPAAIAGVVIWRSTTRQPVSSLAP